MDSLDAVEVVMAIEEEFAVEIPDEEADQITSVAQGTFEEHLSFTCRGLPRNDIMDRSRRWRFSGVQKTLLRDEESRRFIL